MHKDFNPDDPQLKNKIISSSGSTGGMLIGNRHSKSGIKAINKSTGKPLEMEGGEVVITRDAVSDDTRRKFNGEMLTNRQILSRINEGGGGISFAEDGMELPESLNCCGASYEYGGETLSDYELLARLNHEFNTNFNSDDFFENLVSLNDSLCEDLECDGTTKVISHYLDENGFIHKTFIGTINRLRDGEIVDSFSPHQWIETIINGQPTIIDFKSKMWMGNDAPQGIIVKSDLQDFDYVGEEFFIHPSAKKIMTIIQETQKNYDTEQ